MSRTLDGCSFFVLQHEKVFILCYVVFSCSQVTLFSSLFSCWSPLLFLASARSLSIRRVVLLFPLIATTLSHPVISNNFLFWQHGATSTLPLSHVEFEIDHEAWDEQSPLVTNRDLWLENEAATKRKRHSERGGLCERSRSSGTPE